MSRLAVRASALHAAIALLLRIAPSWIIRVVIGGRLPWTSLRPGKPDAPSITTIEMLTDAAGHFGVSKLSRSLCLSRSLTVFWLARRAGLAATLVIGVRPAASLGAGASAEAAGLEAHAWIEEDGRIVPPQQIEAYTPIWRSA